MTQNKGMRRRQEALLFLCCCLIIPLHWVPPLVIEKDAATICGGGDGNSFLSGQIGMWDKIGTSVIEGKCGNGCKSRRRALGLAGVQYTKNQCQ